MGKEQDAKKNRNHKFRGLKIAAGVIAGAWLLLLIVLQIVLSGKFLTRTANRLAAEYVDGTLDIGSISASVFKSFPNLNVTAEDVTLTYPHGKFSEYDPVGVPSRMRERGRGPEADTLASFKTLSLSINYISAIAGHIDIRHARLDRPRIYAHYYDSTAANWNIFRFGDSADTAETALPPITVNRIALTGKPAVVFTDIKDTVFISGKFKKLLFNGKIDTENLSGNRVNFSLDSLKIRGRMPSDTLNLHLRHLVIKERNKVMHFSADADNYLALSSLGRMKIPVNLTGKLSFPKAAVPTVKVKDFEARIATLKLDADFEAAMYGDSTYIKAGAAIDKCSVEEFIRYFSDNLPETAKKFKTDAAISLSAVCDGYYNPAANTLPDINASLLIPHSAIEYEGFPRKGEIEASIKAKTDSRHRLDVTADKLILDFGGIYANSKVLISDLTGNDPEIGIDGKFSASVDTLMTFVPDTAGIIAGGYLHGAVKGRMLASQMSVFNFAKGNLEGYLKSERLSFSKPMDSISTELKNINIVLGKVANKYDRRTENGTEVLAITASIDSAAATFGTSVINSGRLALNVQNAAESQPAAKGREVHPIIGMLSAESLELEGADSLMLGMKGSVNSFKFYLQGIDRQIVKPSVSVTSSNERIFMNQGVNRYGLKDAMISANAEMTGYERLQKRNMRLDSLQKVYPETPRDSLLRRMYRERNAGRRLADYETEKDFEKQDIDIQLGKSFSDYFKDWSFKGKVTVRDGVVITPYFPLLNRIQDFDGDINNNEIILNNLKIVSGTSDLGAKGSLKGLRRMILRHKGVLDLTLSLNSDKLNANELLGAYYEGSKYVAPEHGASEMREMNDEKYISKVTTDTLVNAKLQDESTLFVIPKNLNAKVTVQANEINYSDLNITWLAGDINMNERCIQITNTLATSNMGDIYFEGFYSTKTKKDITAGFDLNMADITADKVIQLFPATDSIMPMLKSFKGQLDCEMAATAALDTNMNFITPSISGTLKIKGSDLSLSEGEAYRKIANLLLFRNRKDSRIENMSVLGLISDNTLVVFPFLLKIDRYALAMSGIQGFDQNFKYHVSVLRSPIPFRFGINLFGNFDNWKYRLGRAKYKDTNVPVYTAQIDTLQMNLVSSIHNILNRSLDLALEHNQAVKASIDNKKDDFKAKTDFDEPVDSMVVIDEKVIDSLQASAADTLVNPANSLLDPMVGRESGLENMPAEYSQAKKESLVKRLIAEVMGGKGEKGGSRKKKSK